MLCPSDTPEGESCGLVKNLALLTHVTTDDEANRLKRMLFMLGVEEPESVCGQDLYANDVAMVFLNGSIVGVHRRVNTLAKQVG